MGKRGSKDNRFPIILQGIYLHSDLERLVLIWYLLSLVNRPHPVITLSISNLWSRFSSIWPNYLLPTTGMSQLCSLPARMMVRKPVLISSSETRIRGRKNSHLPPRHRMTFETCLCTRTSPLSAILPTHLVQRQLTTALGMGTAT